MYLRYITLDTLDIQFMHAYMQPLKVKKKKEKKKKKKKF